MPDLFRPNRSAKLDWLTVQRIRALYAEGWSQGRLAREFGVGVGTIGRIVRHESWVGTAVPPPAEVDFNASAARVARLVGEAQGERDAAEAPAKAVEDFLREPPK